MLPAKSRTVRSSSSMVEMPSLGPTNEKPWPLEPPKNSQAAAAPSSSAVRKLPPPPNMDDKERSSIFELGSPPRDLVLDWTNNQNNNMYKEADQRLETCYLCNKKFKQKDHFYMYGTYLRAFCSPTCRDHQMDLDGFHNQFASEYKEISRNSRNPAARILASGRDQL